MISSGTSGVVATITGNEGSKSSEAGRSPVRRQEDCRLHHPDLPEGAWRAVRELAATQGKRFAVIADEAHSSQTGEAAAKLKAVLSAGGTEAELDDGGEVSTEDILAAQMAARASNRRHHVRRLHRDAEEQDDGDCSARGPTRPAPAGTGQSCPRRFMSIRCARPSRRSSSSTC